MLVAGLNGANDAIFIEAQNTSEKDKIQHRPGKICLFGLPWLTSIKDWDHHELIKCLGKPFNFWNLIILCRVS